MSEPVQTPIEVDAFVLAGERANVKWRITRRIAFWDCQMLVDERNASNTSLPHQPEKGDPLLTKIERNYFHEAS